MSDEDAKPVEEVEVQEEPHGMELWSEKQGVAWGIYGITAMVNTLYWLNVVYYKYWMYDGQMYDAAVNSYTKWGLAATINIVMLLVQWKVTACLWLASTMNNEYAVYFLVKWSSLSHYLQALRFSVVSILKIIGLVTDHNTDYNSYSGWAKTY